MKHVLTPAMIATTLFAVTTLAATTAAAQPKAAEATRSDASATKSADKKTPPTRLEQLASKCPKFASKADQHNCVAAVYVLAKEAKKGEDVDQQVDVYLGALSKKKNGQLVLSRKRAKHLRTWQLILKAEQDDAVLEGLIKRRTKGGFVVDIGGL